jgi:hypothetical protein
MPLKIVGAFSLEVSHFELQSLQSHFTAGAGAAAAAGDAASAAPITAELPSSVANPNARSRTVAPRRMGRRLRALEKVIVLSP